MNASSGMLDEEQTLTEAKLDLKKNTKNTKQINKNCGILLRDEKWFLGEHVRST